MGFLEFLIVLFFVAWIFGAFIVPVGSGLIHFLVVVALVLLIYRLFRGGTGRF